MTEKENKKEKDSVENKDIVMEESPDDVLGKEPTAPDDFKTEVKKEAEKGRALRVFLPIIIFIIVAILVGIGTWYYLNRSQEEQERQEPQEKIQTPPDATNTEPTPTDEKKVTVPTEPATNPDTPVQSDAAPAPAYTNYVVKEGDTMSTIANANGMTSAALAKYNGLSDADSLQIGQKLKIPN